MPFTAVDSHSPVGGRPCTELVLRQGGLYLFLFTVNVAVSLPVFSITGKKKKKKKALWPGGGGVVPFGFQL